MAVTQARIALWLVMVVRDRSFHRARYLSD
jgi:hypothetical protein